MANIPNELLQTLQGLPGFDETSFLKTHLEEARINSIRLNPLKSAPLDFTLNEPVTWCQDAYYLTERPVFTADPLFHAGAYYVQEAGSLFLDLVMRELFDVTQALTVLDLCAAPGGKSTLIQTLLSKESVLVANEVIKQRANVLAMNLSKWGAANTIVTNNDPAHFSTLGCRFDAIVLDAPCSGSGLFRKQPDAVNEWSLEAVQLCSARQKRIVADVLPALKDGGFIIYSTCSYSVSENEEQVQWMENELGLTYIPLKAVNDERIVNTGKGYRFYPHRLPSEGFFIAVLQKPFAGYSGQAHTKSEKLIPSTAKERQNLSGFIQPTDNAFIFKHGAIFKCINTEGAAFLEKYAKRLYILKAGIEIGLFKHDEFIPAQDLAWALNRSESMTAFELTYSEAIAYLKRETVFPLAAKGFKGLALFTYKGLGLGFAKVLPNRVNNYFPLEFRIQNKAIGVNTK